jgi:hypothetical protein
VFKSQVQADVGGVTFDVYHNSQLADVTLYVQQGLAVL